MTKHRRTISCKVSLATRNDGCEEEGRIDYRWGLDMLGLRTEPLMLYLLWKDAMLIMSGSRSGGSF